MSCPTEYICLTDMELLGSVLIIILNSLQILHALLVLHQHPVRVGEYTVSLEELKMEKDSREDKNRYSSADFMVKRKRGRPRKDLRKDSEEQGLSSTPPGYEMGNRDQTRDHDVMLGQPVNGVIEAAFEAGYLLSVTVGNSESMLRGVVFKPGRCVPVSAHNDVAPNIPMVLRNSVSRRQTSRFRHKPGLSRGIKSGASVPIPIQSAQPAISENLFHLDPSRAPPQTAVPINQAPPEEDVHSKTETGFQATSAMMMQTGAGGGKPFETLLTEIMNRVQVGGKTCSVEVDSDEQALSIEPLQAIHPPPHPVHIPKPFPGGYPRGRMTELLQENVRDSSVSRGQ